MRRHPLFLLCVSAALLGLLSACGGGGGPVDTTGRFDEGRFDEATWGE